MAVILPARLSTSRPKNYYERATKQHISFLATIHLNVAFTTVWAVISRGKAEITGAFLPGRFWFCFFICLPTAYLIANWWLVPSAHSNKEAACFHLKEKKRGAVFACWNTFVTHVGTQAAKWTWWYSFHVIEPIKWWESHTRTSGTVFMFKTQQGGDSKNLMGFFLFLNTVKWFRNTGWREHFRHAMLLRRQKKKKTSEACCVI